MVAKKEEEREVESDNAASLFAHVRSFVRARVPIWSHSVVWCVDLDPQASYLFWTPALALFAKDCTFARSRSVLAIGTALFLVAACLLIHVSLECEAAATLASLPFATFPTFLRAALAAAPVMAAIFRFKNKWKKTKKNRFSLFSSQMKWKKKISIQKNVEISTLLRTFAGR